MNEEKFDFNFDNIRLFRDSFKHSLVVFIMDESFVRTNLSKMNSSFQLLQSSLAFYDKSSKGCSKVCICNDHDSAIESMHSMIDSISAAKVNKKLQYFQIESRKHLFPLIENETEFESIINSDIYSKYVKDRVTASLREWGDTGNISEDLSVVINYIRSLEKIMNADEEVLKSIPILKKTRIAILHFFRGITPEGMENKNDEFSNIQNQRSGVFHIDHMIDHVGRLNGNSSQKRSLAKSETDYSFPHMNHDNGRLDWNMLPFRNSMERRAQSAIQVQDYNKAPIFVRDQYHSIVPPTSDSRNMLQYSPSNFRSRFQSYTPGQQESDCFDGNDMQSHQILLDEYTNPFHRYSFE
jgi:hypothetical protein